MRLEELNNLLERASNAQQASAIDSRMDAMVNALADGGRISLSEICARADEAAEKEKESVVVFADPCERQAVVFKKG